MTVKISELTATTLSATQQFEVNDSGVSRRVTLASPLADIATNTANIATNTTNIATNTTNIATNTSNIATNTANIATNTANITILQSQVSGVPARTPLNQTGWSWYNQGSATVSQASNLVYLATPTNAGTNLRGRVVNSPSTPYTITALMWPNPIFFNALFGLGFHESATGKVVMSSIRISNTGVVFTSARKYTNATTFSTASEITTVLITPIYFQITADGTNIVLRYSYDGVNFTQILSETKGTFFTSAPNQYGIFIENFSGQDIGETVASLVVS